MTDSLRFRRICHDVMISDKERNGIGTYGEKLMHVILKKYADPDTSHHEVKCCGYIADIFDGRNITEIQTGNFSPLKKKVAKMADEGYNITIIYPIAAKKWIIWLDPSSGEVTSRRLSPQKCNEYKLLVEMVHALPLLKKENITFRALFLEIEEYRLLDGRGADRKKGSTRCERIPIDIFGDFEVSYPDGYMKFLPDELGEEFSAGTLASFAKITRHRAYGAIRVLKEVGAVEASHKKKNEIFYKRSYTNMRRVTRQTGDSNETREI